MPAAPRPGSSLVAFWAVTGFAILLVGDSLLRADWQLFSVSVAPAGLVVWVAWTILYRPIIRFGDDALIVVNPGRIIEVPWRRIRSASQRFQVVLDLDDGSRVTCWGSPFPEKPGVRRPTPAESRQPRPGREIAGAIEAARNSASGAAADGPVRRRWDVVPLAIGAALVIGCLVDLGFAW
jgi:hypothetical protein